jgi:hypothetical protein
MRKNLARHHEKRKQRQKPEQEIKNRLAVLFAIKYETLTLSGDKS